MDSKDTIARLRQHETELRRLGVERLYLFGSTARGEAGPLSDVDLFFDHPEGAISLLDLIDVRSLASAILGRPADVLTRRSLHPAVRRRVEESARLVF